MMRVLKALISSQIERLYDRLSNTTADFRLWNKVVAAIYGFRPPTVWQRITPRRVQAALHCLRGRPIVAFCEFTNTLEFGPGMSNVLVMGVTVDMSGKTNKQSNLFLPSLDQ